MSHVKRLKRSAKSFRRLTGIGLKEFDQVVDELMLGYQEDNTKRLQKKHRQRAPGAGGQFRLRLEDRLLMLLIYYRCYVTHAFLGFLFGIDDSNVGRNINPLGKLLAGLFRIPEKRIRLESEEIEVLFFDGTEQRIQRPKQGQKRHYSGKKRGTHAKYKWWLANAAIQRVKAAQS